jgi:phage/plasmid-associated DNA primase
MGCNPEKASMNRKRYIVFREPSSKKKFENSAIKEMTGGGTFSARGLYDSNITKELNNTMICECNEKPVFNDDIKNADARRIL